MFRDFDYITSIEFPETAEYIEKIIPDTVDEVITYAGAIDFKFRQHKNVDGFRFPIPGLRTQKKYNYKIETKSELSFKSGDMIRFDSDDRKKYVVTNIEYQIDKRNEQEYQFTNQDWPGMAGDSIKFKIITIE
jgi:hypothetical protein